MNNNGQTNPTIQLTDEEIIHQVRNGSKAEQNSLVEYLYQRFHGMVVQIISRMGGDQGEDTAFILNDSLLVLMEKILDRTYQPERSSLSTYFYAIAEKQELNRLRKRKRRQLNGEVVPPLHLNFNDVEEKMGNGNFDVMPSRIGFPQRGRQTNPAGPGGFKTSQGYRTTPTSPFTTSTTPSTNSTSATYT